MNIDDMRKVRDAIAGFLGSITDESDNYVGGIERLRLEDALGILDAELEHGDSEARLRKLLAVCYAGADLYADDGELQDNRRAPFIDFRRDPVERIEQKMTERGKAALELALSTRKVEAKA